MTVPLRLVGLCFVLLVGWLFPSEGVAQETEGLDSLDTQQEDTLQQVEQRSVGVNRPGDTAPADTVVIEMVAKDHSPRRAALYSAVLPGLGQIYNKKYWKLPILYGGFAILGYLVVWNNDQYQVYRRARIAEENNQSSQSPFAGLEGSRFQNISIERLANAVDQSRRNRDFTIILTAGLYGLNIMDAIVDAHLIEFDVNPDLSLKLEPTRGARLAYINMSPSLSYTGLSLTLDIK